MPPRLQPPPSVLGRHVVVGRIDEIATQAPTDLEALSRLRAAPKGFAGSRFAPELLTAVREALASPEAQAPNVEKPRNQPPPQGASAVVELLKVLLKARAEEAGVASKLIATVADLEKIAAEDEADSPALQGWRRDAFGADALKIKRGELALVLDGGKVRVRLLAHLALDGDVLRLTADEESGDLLLGEQTAKRAATLAGALDRELDIRSG